MPIKANRTVFAAFGLSGAVRSQKQFYDSALAGA